VAANLSASVLAPHGRASMGRASLRSARPLLEGRTRTGKEVTPGLQHPRFALLSRVPPPILETGGIHAVWNRNRRRSGASPGFSLIELMLVVLLIGVLLAVAMPFFRGFKEKARIAQAVHDITAISAAATNYSIDNRAYPASLADIGLAGKVDPWGNPYVYYNIDANGKGGARKDHALNPLNTDFDVYSMGPDGQTKPQITQSDSLDDVIRASNGTFVGLATDF
jgi:general secretion pathway protein G